MKPKKPCNNCNHKKGAHVWNPNYEPGGNYQTFETYPCQEIGCLCSNYIGPGEIFGTVVYPFISPAAEKAVENFKKLLKKELSTNLASQYYTIAAEKINPGERIEPMSDGRVKRAIDLSKQIIRQSKRKKEPEPDEELTWYRDNKFDKP